MGSLFAGDSATPTIPDPETHASYREAAPFPENVERSDSSVIPLDMPLSDFGRGRVSPVESRIQTPAIVKSVPSPYFESAESPRPAIAPMMTLTDFLEAVPPVEPVLDKPVAPSLLPPEPIAEVALLDAPGEVAIVPGMDDTVFRPISQIQPYYAYSPTGKNPGEYLCPQPSSIPEDQRARCPEIQPLPPSGTTQRHFALVDYQWCPTNLHHKPLYFEDVALERYGQQYPYGIQPFVSIGKFGVQGIGLPYQIALDPLWRDIYVLGYYRPGDNAPELLYQVPFNMKAAAAAGGAYTGLLFLFP